MAKKSTAKRINYTTHDVRGKKLPGHFMGNVVGIALYDFNNKGIDFNAPSRVYMFDADEVQEVEIEKYRYKHNWMTPYYNKCSVLIWEVDE